MISVIQVSDIRNVMPPLRNWDVPLTMYYDETNNIRRLRLSEVGLNSRENRPFVIAGIVSTNGLPDSSETDLRKLLQIQKTATEIKYEHVAGSSYEKGLASKKISLLLNWLVENNMFIHYLVLDVLHWSILDIVESLMPGDPLGINLYHLELKTELCYIVRHNPDGFMALLHRFSYPNLERSKVPQFINEVLFFLESQDIEDRNHVTAILKDVLARAAKIQCIELPFLHDNEPGDLIKDFSAHFLHCVYAFKNSHHIFDRETYVEKALRNIEIRDGENRLDYKFIDSKAEIGVQISDVVAGLIGRHFGYVQEHSLPYLRAKKAGFSQVQLDNLSLLRSLIERSNDFSEGLLRAVAPLDTLFQNDAFLHDLSVPDFLG